MMQEDAIQNAHATLARSLQTMNCRCTPERRAILDAACSMGAPFSIADIAAQMASQGFKVSRATLYNTLRLLVDLRLIVCLRMQNCTRYEAVDPTRARCRQVCTVCGRTMEVSVQPNWTGCPEPRRDASARRLMRSMSSVCVLHASDEPVKIRTLTKNILGPQGQRKKNKEIYEQRKS